MRTAFALAALVAVSGCGPDLTVGTFTFTLTGSDNETAPRTQTTGVAGTGTMAVTPGSAVDYVITVAQNDVGPCVLNLERSDKDNGVNIASGQACVFNYSTGQVTATMTSGAVTLNEKGDTLTLNVAYNWAGSALGINFAGNGTRTYVGSRR